MKEYRLLPKNTIFFFCFFSIITFFCSSCNLFGLKVHDYLKEYTENAAVLLYQLDKEYPLDKEGFVSVPSDKELNVYLILRNPKKYKLDFNYEFKTETVEKWSDSADSGKKAI